ILNRIIAALYSLRQYEKAMNECSELINFMLQNKEYSDSWKNLLGKIYIRAGGCHYWLGNYDKAQGCYNEALLWVTQQPLKLKAQQFLKLAKQSEETKAKSAANKKKIKIPPHILFNIAEYLDVKQIAILNRVSKAFHELAESRLLWKQLCDRDFPNVVRETKDWKSLYLDLLSGKLLSYNDNPNPLKLKYHQTDLINSSTITQKPKRMKVD